MLSAQRRDQRRIAHVGYTGDERIALRRARRNGGVERRSEAAGDLHFPERDAGNIAGIELVQERALGHGCRFARLLNEKSGQQDQHRNDADAQPELRSSPPRWFGAICCDRSRHVI
ncbi:hypothetical protein [Sinorhizobium meliloti]|uniref:hypothetical protein n=1 Tax=Rhizobium meliloti TaxID=382 RepID=UPI0012FD0C1D|nr:hypothetical protein [Sinorhizobium meliloti]